MNGAVVGSFIAGREHKAGHLHARRSRLRRITADNAAGPPVVTDVSELSGVPPCPIQAAPREVGGACQQVTEDAGNASQSGYLLRLALGATTAKFRLPLY